MLDLVLLNEGLQIQKWSMVQVECRGICLRLPNRSNDGAVRTFVQNEGEQFEKAGLLLVSISQLTCSFQEFSWFSGCSLQVIIRVNIFLSSVPRMEECPLVFSSRTFPKQRCSESYLHDLTKAVAERAGLKKEEWHLHRFRDTAATRWLRAGVDVRTVQQWLGHESLATTQKYLEPSKETKKVLSKMKLPF